MHRPLRWIRTTIRVIAIGVIVGSLLLVSWFAFYEHDAERLTIGERPVQFYAALNLPLDVEYDAVIAIAHNSGDNVAVAREALAHGADAIEIDVVMLDGDLYAAHTTPPRLVGRHLFRGPRLATVWGAASDADVIVLDLKQSSPVFLDLVVAFLNEHPARQVVVSSRSPAALLTVEAEAPHALRFLSIGGAGGLEALQDEPALVSHLDGVGIRQDLLTETSAHWLGEHGLLIHAWVVNDGARMTELIVLGVDAITTDNLAIMALLGGGERHER